MPPVCQCAQGINTPLPRWRPITFPRLNFLSPSRHITIRLMAQSYRVSKIKGQREGGDNTRRVGRAKQC